MLHNVHPAWKVCAGIAIVVMVTLAYAGRVLQTQQRDIDANAALLRDIRTQQDNARERGFINRAIAGCVDLINDMEVEITDECVDPDIAKYYPPSICAKLVSLAIPNCGRAANVVMPLGVTNE